MANYLVFALTSRLDKKGQRVGGRWREKLITADHTLPDAITKPRQTTANLGATPEPNHLSQPHFTNHTFSSCSLINHICTATSFFNHTMSVSPQRSHLLNQILVPMSFQPHLSLTLPATSFQPFPVCKSLHQSHTSCHLHPADHISNTSYLSHLRSHTLPCVM